MPTSRAIRSFSLLSVLALILAGCKPGGGGSGSESKENVLLFASRAKLTAASGASDVAPSALLATLGGQILLTDARSSTVLGILGDGSVILFVSKADLTGATGEASVALGPFDQVRSGALSGRLLAADAVSGNLLVIDTNGDPAVFSSKSKVTNVTGKATASMALPRELTTNQIVAQDLESLELLRFDTAGNPTPFVSGAQIAAAAGVAAAQAAVVEWERGPATQSLYGRVAASSSVIRVQINGQVSLHVSAAVLAGLFRDVADLRVLDIVVNTSSDGLLLLIGDGPRGVAVARVAADGSSADAYTPRAKMRKAGGGVDVSDLLILPNGIPVAVDRGGAQVLTFDADGNPAIVGRGADIRLASGSANPRLSLAVGLSTGEAVVMEEDSGSLLLVR